MPKGFKEAAAAAKPVYRTIIGRAANTQEVQEVQDTQEVQDVQEVQSALGTQGRKGARLPRINMAFSEENLTYLRVMAALQGQSITRYVNALIEADRKKNTGTYQAAQRLAEGEHK